MKNGFFLNDGSRAQYRTASELDRAMAKASDLGRAMAEEDGLQYAKWEILPGCAKSPCEKVAEFVHATGPYPFDTHHLCYEHGKDEPNAIRCLCKPQKATDFM